MCRRGWSNSAASVSRRRADVGQTAEIAAEFAAGAYFAASQALARPALHAFSKKCFALAVFLSPPSPNM
jgi:hypothetical protein